MFDIESVSNIEKCRECHDPHGYLVPVNTPFLRNAYDLEYAILKKPAYFCTKCLGILGFLRDIKPATPKEVTVDKLKKKAVIKNVSISYAGQRYFFNDLNGNKPGF